MLTVQIDAPSVSRPLCVPQCPKCGFPMNVHFSQQPIGERMIVAIFGHCVRCMHLENIKTQEVNCEQEPEAGTDPVAGRIHRRSAAGG